MSKNEDRDNAVSHINKNIFQLADIMINVAKPIKERYLSEVSDRRELLSTINKEINKGLTSQLKKSFNHRVEFDDEITRKVDDFFWSIDDICQSKAFIEKKGKISFKIRLVGSENQFDEIVNVALFEMIYYPLSDEITYYLTGLGLNKIEKASSLMRKSVKIKRRDYTSGRVVY